MKKIVVLISGQGSNLQALIDAQQQGRISGKISAVFSNNPAAYGLERAESAGIPHHALDAKAFTDRVSFDLALAQAIDQYQPDLWSSQVICVFSVQNLLNTMLGEC